MKNGGKWWRWVVIYLMAAVCGIPAGADLRIFAFASWARAEASTNVAGLTREQAREFTRKLDQAYSLLSRGRFQEAAALFRAALRVDPKNFRARFGLANTLMQLYEYEEARDILEVLAQEQPTDYVVKNNLAWLYATAKDRKVRDGAKALMYAQEALLLEPRSYNVWSTLAEAHYVLGQYERALRAARIAVDLAQQERGTELNIQTYLQQLDKCERAAAALSIVE